MPLDYAVGILDYRLIWNGTAGDSQISQQTTAAESSSAAPVQPQQPPAGDAAAPSTEAAGGEDGGDAASCFPELDEETSASHVHQDACVLHPEFRKLDIGINAINNAALEPSLAFLKSAVEKLKKV